MSTTLQFTGSTGEYVTAKPFDVTGDWSMQWTLDPNYVAGVEHGISRLGIAMDLRVKNLQLELVVNGNTYQMGVAQATEHKLQLIQTPTTVEVWVNDAKIGDSGTDIVAPGTYSLTMLDEYSGTCVDMHVMQDIYPMREGSGLTLWSDYQGDDTLGPMSVSPTMSGNWVTAVNAYCNRSDIEAIYGKTNVVKWADIENDGDVTEIADRIRNAITETDDMINDTLRAKRYDTPFAQPIPKQIKRLSANAAGVFMYEYRGITDFDASTGTTDHQLQLFQSRVDKMLNKILAGQITLDGSASGTSKTMTPRAVPLLPVSDLGDLR